MSKKKIILIILFILTAIGLAYLIYIVFFKPAPAPPEVVPPEKVEAPPPRLPVSREQWERMTIKERAEQGLPLYEWEEEALPPTAPAKPEVPSPLAPEKAAPEISEIAQGGKTWVMLVDKEETKFATLAADGKNSIFYNPKEGKFYKIDLEGNKTLLTEDTFPNVKNIYWSPTKDKAILEFPDGFKITYNFKTKKQYTLPNNWKEFSWSPDGSRIAFKLMGEYPETTWLAVSLPDGSNARAVEHMGDNADKVIVDWSPNHQVVAFSKTGEARGEFEQEILFIGQYHQNWPGLIVDGRGFKPKWSPSGDKLLYSVYSPNSGYRPELYLVNGRGRDIGTGKIKLGIFTWPHKCAFNKDGSYLYCAVPRDMPFGVGLVPELKGLEIDDFYKIDTSTGHASFLAEGAMGGYDVSQIYISDDESLLYFVDKRGKLRYIKLK